MEETVTPCITIDPPNFDTKYPLEEPRPSPLLIRIHIRHLVIQHSNSQLQTAVDSTPTFWTQSATCWSAISFFNGDEDSILDFFSPVFTSLDISSPSHTPLANAISEKINACPHVVEYSDKECILNVNFRVHSIRLDDDCCTMCLVEVINQAKEISGMIERVERKLDLVKVEGISCCSICLEDIGEFASAMPCKHMFHEDCIVTWLMKRNACPICRFELTI